MPYTLLRFQLFVIGLFAIALVGACSRDAQPVETASPARPAPASTSAATAPNAESTQNPAAGLRRAPACDLISRAEMAELLDGAIGKPSGENSSNKTSCTWPPADAGSRAQAEITIEWDRGTEASFESQLAGAFGGSAVGRRAAHTVPLGDEAAYSLEGVLTVRTGRTLVTISLPMRPGAEEHSIAVARKLFERIGADPTPKAAPSAQETKPQNGLGQALDALNTLDAASGSAAEPATAAKSDTSVVAAKPATVPAGAIPVSDIHELQPGAECPQPGPELQAAIAKAESALIPLKVGLTLSHVWKANTDDYEHECLSQVTAVDARSVSTTDSCPHGPKRELVQSRRRICWTDFADSYIYFTSTHPKYPDSFVGSLQFSLSQASFAALKAHGEFHHRYLELDDDNPAYVLYDLDGTMRSEGPGTFKIIINDKTVEVPTIETMSVNLPHNDLIRMKILDDPYFPFMLDYYIPSLHKFFITYTKVSFPAPQNLEQSLAQDKHTDVYGIYFDFAKATLRTESHPVLQEIADALKAHPDWTLVINGHTDSIGNDQDNLTLSKQRAEAVRAALVTEFAIAEARLSVNGFGASQPKESNDTDRGRALNRRVELIRQ